MPGAQEGASVDTAGAVTWSVAFSPDGTKGYIGSGGLVREVNAATGATLASIAVPGTPRGMAASPDGSTLYVPTTAGQVAVVDLATYTVTASIPLYDGVHLLEARYGALNPDGTSLYVTATWGGTSFRLVRIDTATRQAVAIGSTGTSPTGLAVSADGRMVLSTRSNFSARLDTFDADTLAPGTSVNVNASPGPVDSLGTIAVGSDPSLVYVADSTAQDVVVVNVATGQVVRRLSGFPSVAAVAINWAGTQLLVAGSDAAATPYPNVVWELVDPATGAVRSSGRMTGVAGGYRWSVPLAICPRLVAAPAQDSQPSPSVLPGGAAPGRTCPSPLVTALDRPRLARSRGRVVVRQSVRLDQPGRYTFLYEDASGRRVPLLAGSRLSTRVLGATFTATVRTAVGPAERVVLTARLARRTAAGVHLRVVRRAVDGVLCAATT